MDSNKINICSTESIHPLSIWFSYEMEESWSRRRSSHLPLHGLTFLDLNNYNIYIDIYNLYIYLYVPFLLFVVTQYSSGYFYFYFCLLYDV